MFKLSAWLRWSFLALIAFTLTIACTQQPNTTTAPSASTPAGSAQPLTSGVNSWVGYSSHYVAMKQEFFVKEGLNVQELFFQSASEEITSVLAGKVDVA